jgi:hypothetical protein
MAFTIITGGSFTSTGAGVKINLPSSADYFHTWNMTQMPLAPATGVVVQAEWFGKKFGLGASAVNDGIRWKKTNSTNAINIDTFSTATASNGFTYIESAPVVEAQAANAITAITAASPAVVSQTNTYSNDDIIQFYGTTGMLQISGMNFQISSVSGSTYTLIGLRAAGFAAAATAGFTRRISKFAAVDPQFLYVTEITQATQAVVRTSVDPTNYYVVGMKVHFSVPASFGMTQINQLTGTITAMSAANYTMTVDIDTTAFTAFAFPTSASSPTAQLFATIAPAGAKTAKDPITLVETGYNFQVHPFHSGNFVPYMFLAGGAQSPAGANLDQINWMAYKLEN